MGATKGPAPQTVEKGIMMTTSGTSPSMEDARTGKKALVALCENIAGTSSIGIGSTEDGSGLAVTVAIADEKIADRIPAEIDGVPVRWYIDEPQELYAD